MQRLWPGLSVGLAVLLLTVRLWAAPCSTSTATCSEWVIPTGASNGVLAYRTYALDAKNPAITSALVVIHGAGRDADNYFQHVLAGAFLAGALETTIVVSPRFASNDGAGCRDTIAANELKWQCGGPERWTAGGGAVDDAKTTSFDVADELLRKLARKDIFPNLRSIVFAGHSAGGQFVSRYEMSNQVHDTLGVPITYVVANPSSYAYLDNLRPSASALPQNVWSAAPGYVAPPSANPPAPFIRFSDANNCTTYDKWPYGLQNRVGYTAKLTDDQLKKQLSARPTTYLLGGLDILPLFGFDGSCAAMAQGPTRLARGLAFGKYVNERFGAMHSSVIVPACGHNARCMFTDNTALTLLFPKKSQLP
jgi:pimeloyl-ACP methyl ester carboxylesterase